MTTAPDLAALLLPAAVLAPLACAVLSILVPARARRGVGLAGALLTAGLGLAVVVVVITLGPVETALAGRTPPLGIAVRADGPAAVFLLLTSVVGVLVSLFAALHPRSTGVEGAREWYWPAWLLGWGGLTAVFLSADLFNLYVAIELVGLSAVLLVALGGPGSWRAAFRYLMVTVTGSLLFLVALTMTYAATGTLDLRLAGEQLAAEPGAHVTIILALAATGMAFKSALFPLHGWLPDAHGGAPGAVSPLLSALVVKSSFFVLFRVWTKVTGPDAVVGAALGIAAAGSVLWGGVAAVRTPRLKRLAGYSTVSQVGYLFLYFPLSAAAGADREQQQAALIAVALLALAHGLAKSSLFLSAGIVKDRLGTDRITAMTDHSSTMPLVTMSLALAGVSLAGLPVTLGFAGKWQLLLAAVDTALWWIVAVAVAGTLLAAMYLLRPVQTLLAGEAGGDYNNDDDDATNTATDTDTDTDTDTGTDTGTDDSGSDDPDTGPGTSPGTHRAPAVPRAAVAIPLAAALMAVLAIAASGPLAELAVLGVGDGGAA